MKEVVIVSACRTAIGSFGGSLKDSHAVTLGKVVMQEAVKRAGIDPGLINDVRFGNCFPPYVSMNLTRLAALQAGIPDTTTAVTVNRVCLSGMEAIVSGMAMIQAGLADIVMSGGTEHMSGVAYAAPGARWGCRLQNSTLDDMLTEGLMAGSRHFPCSENSPLAGGMPYDMFKGKPYSMGLTAEFIAQLHNISREEMDAISVRSHNNVERATLEGDFVEEIVPVEIPQKRGKPSKFFDKDEHFKPGVTLDDLAQLPPAFIPKTGKVTAGNASGINDGASATLIMSAEKAIELGLKPLARIKAVGYGGCDPAIMGMSPVPATRDMMKRSGLQIKDFELIELNEAFSSQYLACERELGLNRELTNINGSGIGMGHPVGSTGCRIIVSLIYAMRKHGKTLGLATMCGGGGVSIASAIELI